MNDVSTSFHARLAKPNDISFDFCLTLEESNVTVIYACFRGVQS